MAAPELQKTAPMRAFANAEGRESIRL